MSSQPSASSVNTGVEGPPSFPVVGELPGRLAHDEVEVTVTVEVTQGGSRVAATRQGRRRGVDELQIDRAVGGPVPVKRQLVVPGAYDRVQVAVTVEVTERRNPVIAGATPSNRPSSTSEGVATPPRFTSRCSAPFCGSSG